VNTADKNQHAKNAGVPPYANTENSNQDAKNVVVLNFANMTE